MEGRLIEGRPAVEGAIVGRLRGRPVVDSPKEGRTFDGRFAEVSTVGRFIIGWLVDSWDSSLTDERPMEGGLAEGRPGRPGRPIVESAVVGMPVETGILVKGRLDEGRLTVGDPVERPIDGLLIVGMTVVKNPLEKLKEGEPLEGRPAVDRLIRELLEGRLILGRLFVGGMVVAGGLFKLGNPTKGMLVGS